MDNHATHNHTGRIFQAMITMPNVLSGPTYSSGTVVASTAGAEPWSGNRHERRRRAAEQRRSRGRR